MPLLAMESLPSGFDLAQGERVLATVSPNPWCLLIVTDQQIVLWEWKGGLESLTPVKLADVYEVEVTEKRGAARSLIAGLVLSLGGAALLPWLVQSLVNWGVGQPAYQLPVGVTGFGLLLWGLVLLGRFLRRALFPDLVLVLRGTVELRMEVGAGLSRRLVDTVRLIQGLKAKAD